MYQHAFRSYVGARDLNSGPPSRTARGALPTEPSPRCRGAFLRDGSRMKQDRNCQRAWSSNCSCFMHVYMSVFVCACMSVCERERMCMCVCMCKTDFLLHMGLKNFQWPPRSHLSCECERDDIHFFLISHTSYRENLSAISTRLDICRM